MNKLERKIRELTVINEDLPKRFKDKCSSVDDFDIYSFEQIWGSTALGFSGIGGSMCTAATTYVFVPVECYEKCFVYFGAGFAYSADYNDEFKKDLAAQCMKPVYKSGVYRRKDNVCTNTI